MMLKCLHTNRGYQMGLSGSRSAHQNDAVRRIDDPDHILAIALV
jgi:hypothetical protein